MSVEILNSSRIAPGRPLIRFPARTLRRVVASARAPVESENLSGIRTGYRLSRRVASPWTMYGSYNLFGRVVNDNRTPRLMARAHEKRVYFSANVIRKLPEWDRLPKTIVPKTLVDRHAV